MMKKVLVIISILFCFKIAYGNDLLPENLMDGAKLFVNKDCIRCHSIKGEGGKVGPDLGRIRIEGSVFDIAALMWNHIPYMIEKANHGAISWPKFSEKEILNIIGYLYYIGYFDEPGNPDIGKILFDKKGCVKCHAVNGKGGKMGPPLDKFNKKVSPIFMAQSMWNHGPDMDKMMKKMRVRRLIFKENEMRDLLAYIRKRKVKKIFISPGDVNRGKKLFSEKGCIKCHPIKGKGGMVAPDLGKKSKELKQNLNRIAGILWNLSPNMWEKMKKMGISYPKFSGREMADVIAYLYFLGYFEEDIDISKGKELFNKKGCVRCHPRLRKFSTPIEGFANMWNNALSMEESMSKIGINWPIFKEGEMGNLLEYMRGGKK
jgi:cytochrome c551/c552